MDRIAAPGYLPPVLEDSVTLREYQNRISAARAALRGRQRRVIGWFVAACLSFLSGLAWPSTTVAAALIGVAALAFLASAAAVVARNYASDELARLRLEAER